MILDTNVLLLMRRTPDLTLIASLDRQPGRHEETQTPDLPGVPGRPIKLPRCIIKEW